MSEKPWHAILREYFGYLSFVMWPYRAYQWAKAYNAPQQAKGPPPLPKASGPPPLPSPAPTKKKAKPKKNRDRITHQRRVTYHSFLGNGWFVGIPLFLGVTTIAMSLTDGGFQVGYFVWGWCLVLFAITYFVMKKRQVDYVPVAPKPRAADELPTEEETKKAHNHLRVALAYKNEMVSLKDVDMQVMKLGEAAMALAKARALDPGVTVTDTVDGENTTYTQDDLAAELLYFEALAYKLKTEAALRDSGANFMDKYVRELYEKKANEARSQARTAIEKALKYHPNSTQLLGLAAEITGGQAAKRYIERALQIDPDNIEILKLQSRME